MLLRSPARPSHAHRQKQATPRATTRSRSLALRPVAKVSLVRPVAVENAKQKPLLLYLPGTDGTGNSIIPQLPGLVGAGFDIRSLYISMDDRSSWDSLIEQIVPLAKQLAHSEDSQRKLTIVAESFGGCLAFRLALAIPELIANMVVVNSATCFTKSYSGIVNLIAASNLLSLFPEQLYQVAQAVLVPLLVDKEKVGPSSLRAIKSMMVMQPPPTFTAELGLVQAPASDAAERSKRSPDLYLPSATASWRMNMLTSGNLPDASFRQIRTPVLLVGSGQDRLLPSLTEQTRLQRLLPNANRLVLPDSGHTALLEVDVDLVSIMARTGFLPAKGEPAHAASLVTQGGSQVGQVQASPQQPASQGALQNQDMPKGGWQAAAVPTTPATAGSSTTAAAGQQTVTAATASGQGQAQRESVSNKRPAEQRSAPAQSVGRQQPQANEASVAGLNDNGAATQQPARTAQGNGSTAGTNAASPATDTVEKWVSDNLTAFASDPDSSSELPSIAADAQTGEPSAADPACDPLRRQALSAASTSQQQQQQQQPQQQQGQSEQPGANGVAQAAKRSWGGVQQQGPKGAWQGRGQGPEGGRGGSWATVDDQMESARRLLSPWRSLVAPVVKGVENLPDPLGPRRPLLFIGNHTIIGLYDLPLLVHELYLRGYKVRGLAHPGHWATPLGPLFQSLGAVKASPMAAYRLLQDAEAVLLFPGGGREVNKRKGEKYKLIWKDKPDFVRMAAKSNALIIPFAAVGGDDAFDIALDPDEVLANPVLGPLAKQLSRQVFKGSPLEGSDDAITPITKLPGSNIPALIPVPKLERLYFRFMPPVDAAAALPDRSDTVAAKELYHQIKRTVEKGIQQTLQDREADPERDLGKRLVRQVQRVVPSFDLLVD